MLKSEVESGGIGSKTESSKMERGDGDGNNLVSTSDMDEQASELWAHI